jgi:hypothetical protein
MSLQQMKHQATQQPADLSATAPAFLPTRSVTP